MSIDPKKLAEWRRLAEAATPGPWTADLDRRNPDHHLLFADGRDIADVRPWAPIEETRANARFIAAARSALPALLDEVERLREVLGEIETHVSSNENAPTRVLAVIGRVARAALSGDGGGA